jgi:uncharacterized membrane protein YgcG
MNQQGRFRNMNIFRRAAGFSNPRLSKQALVSLLSLVLLFATWPRNLSANPEAQPMGQNAQAPPYEQQTPEQLQQLTAPIALYPDSLVAQVLAASTFPEQVVEANRWVQSHPDLKGDTLARAVDQQPWDPSVKALTAFPSVLGNMDKNISWTSSLGDAYYNQQQDVMDAVQTMRQRAQQAGNLNSTPQQTVARQGSNIVIQPASPTVVYVPAYDPWLVYGGPIVAWPGWYPYPGIWFGGPYLSFGIGFGIGFYGGYGWGWNHWGSNWSNHSVYYNNNRYYSQSRTFYNRSSYYRGTTNTSAAARSSANASNRTANANTAAHTSVYNRPGATTRPFNGNTQAARGYAQPHGQTGVNSGALSGYNHGGEARSYSSRGSASMNGGASHTNASAAHSSSGGSHSGGGGSHGGGGGGHK